MRLINKYPILRYKCQILGFFGSLIPNVDKISDAVGLSIFLSHQALPLDSKEQDRRGRESDEEDKRSGVRFGRDTGNEGGYRG